jgi:putative membrane protein
LGWFALVFSAHLLAGGRPWRTGLLVLAWDTGLEALMTAKGYWVWHDPSPLWYGAPPQNYLAWFMVGSLLSLLFSRMAPCPRDGGFAWAYRLEALFVPTGLALLGLWPAALVCGLAMNLLAWPWIPLVKRRPQTVA